MNSQSMNAVAPATTRPLSLLALSACMAGALALGAAVGAWFATRAPGGVERAAAHRDAPRSEPRDPALERAIAQLAAEIGALRRQLEVAPARRGIVGSQLAAESASGAPAEAGAWVAASERAAAALSTAVERTPSVGTAGVRMSAEPMGAAA